MSRPPLIPGAEHAPFVLWSSRNGHRLALAEDLARLALVPEISDEDAFEWWAVGDNLESGEMIRRLSCADSMDMRSIWYWAALELGATEEQARIAVLFRDNVDLGWVLCCGRVCHWFGPASLTSHEQATAALCRSVRGST